MKSLKVLFPCFALLLVFAKCEKDPMPDPNSFYFQCKLNGKWYLPNNCANCMTADFYGDTSVIIGANNGFESIRFGIDNHPVLIPKTYQLINEPGKRATYDNSPQVNDYYRTQPFNPGSFTISSIDKTKKIITGSFNFVAYHSLRTNDSVIVNSGKFRLKYTVN